MTKLFRQLNTIEHRRDRAFIAAPVSSLFSVRDGGQGRDRTADTRIFSPLLYQLSYLAIPCIAPGSALREGVQKCCNEVNYNKRIPERKARPTSSSTFFCEFLLKTLD